MFLLDTERARKVLILQWCFFISEDTFLVEKMLGSSTLMKVANSKLNLDGIFGRSKLKMVSVFLNKWKKHIRNRK